MNVNVYIGAPTWSDTSRFRRRRVRSVGIEDAATGKYLYEWQVPVRDDVPDACVVIEGRVTYSDGRIGDA